MLLVCVQSSAAFACDTVIGSRPVNMASTAGLLVSLSNMYVRHTSRECVCVCVRDTGLCREVTRGRLLPASSSRMCAYLLCDNTIGRHWLVSCHAMNSTTELGQRLHFNLGSLPISWQRWATRHSSSPYKEMVALYFLQLPTQWIHSLVSRFQNRFTYTGINMSQSLCVC